MSASDKKHPARKASALRYTPDREDAPRVVAKGRGTIADKIVALAKEHDIPLVENPDLAQLIDALDVDTQIPPELYRAVAQVLVFVYRLNKWGE